MAEINQIMVTALNNQLTYERFSAAVYEALGAEFDVKNMVGMSSWMCKQANEELSHANKIKSYLADRNAAPVIDAIGKPDVPQVGDAVMMGSVFFNAALAHERTVTARIDTLFQLARQLGDPATEVFLQWFVTEQVEEERILEEIMTKFEIAGDDGAAILMLDHDLGAR